MWALYCTMGAHLFSFLFGILLFTTWLYPIVRFSEGPFCVLTAASSLKVFRLLPAVGPANFFVRRLGVYSRVEGGLLHSWITDSPLDYDSSWCRFWGCVCHCNCDFFVGYGIGLNTSHMGVFPLRNFQHVRSSLSVSYTHLDVYKRQELNSNGKTITMEFLVAHGLPFTMLIGYDMLRKYSAIIDMSRAKVTLYSSCI